MRPKARQAVDLWTFSFATKPRGAIPAWAMPPFLARLRETLLSKRAQVVWRVQLPLALATGILLHVGFTVQRIAWDRMQARGQELVLTAWDATAWIAWPLALPVMWLMIQRFPLAKGMLPRNALRLAGGSALLLIAVGNLRFALRMLQVWWGSENSETTAWTDYLTTALVLFPFDFLIYCGFFSAALAIDKHFRHRQRQEEAIRLELRTVQLESELAQAELQTLRGQLHPHFLFNSFNAVATLVRQRRNDTAIDVIAELSMLLRLAIDRTGRHEVAFVDEVDFIRRYLHIEWVRFGEKLLLEYAIDPATLQASVPNLLLQPLVENTIKHGIAKRCSPGTVRIAAKRVSDRLEIEIENDGPDQPEESTSRAPTAVDQRQGIGLPNTRARLAHIYGANHRIQLKARPDGGMLVCLSLPWREVERPVQA